MDRLRSLKGRIGEAFVESILRRAGYKVSRIGRESQVQQMLRTGISEFLLDVAEQWPDLYVILVTDNPEPTRSCFQAIDLRGYRPDAPLTTADLHDLPVLDIYRSTVEEYEGLVKQVFSLLGSHERSPELPQKPPAKMSPEPRPVRITAIQETWP